LAAILIVDDEPSVRTFLGLLFSDDGYEVRVAAHGQQALEMVGKEVPDVVLSDIMMPIVGGAELCRRLKGAPATAGVPVILMSGAPSPPDLGGADAYISKPFELVEMEALVRRCLSDVKREVGQRWTTG